METIKYPQIEEITPEQLLIELQHYKNLLYFCLDERGRLLDDICKLKYEILKLKQEIEFGKEEENGED